MPRNLMQHGLAARSDCLVQRMVFTLRRAIVAQLVVLDGKPGDAVPRSRQDFPDGASRYLRHEDSPRVLGVEI